MEGAWPPGEKLEALRLAADLGVSMTPVRDCLNRLVGERLVDMHPGEGYRVPSLSEQTLRDMLDLNLLLLEAACEPDATGSFKIPDEARGGYADRTAALFDAIASRLGNQVLVSVITSLNERLHIFRTIEPEVLPQAEAELALLEQHVASEATALRTGLRAYHELRYGKVAMLLQAAITKRAS
jgi:DNA-binding FadR family transcriptional regulator